MNKGSSSSSNTDPAAAAVPPPPPLPVAVPTWEEENGNRLPTPRQFYDRFVRPRRPVRLRQQCAAVLGNPRLLDQLGSVRQLRELVETETNDDDDGGGGERNRMVEVNVSTTTTTTTSPSARTGEEKTTSASTTASFSPLHGSRVIAMPFAEFCAHLEAGCNDYYMTTPTLPLDEEGRPAVCNWLTQRLLRRNVVPLRPRILGHLIPMSAANVWLGRTAAAADDTDNNNDTNDNSPSSASSGGGGSSGSSGSGSTSSGLHHDMHDNLYCLLAGAKTVRVAPPSAVQSACRMVGRLHTVHGNGRIVYFEQLQSEADSNDSDGACPVRPDGALASVERIVQLEVRRDAVERELADLVCSSDDGDDDDGDDDNNDDSDAKKKRRRRRQDHLEEQLDAIEEELLDIEMAGAATDGDGGATTTSSEEDDDEEEDDERDDDDHNEDGAPATATATTTTAALSGCSDGEATKTRNRKEADSLEQRPNTSSSSKRRKVAPTSLSSSSLPLDKDDNNGNNEKGPTSNHFSESRTTTTSTTAPPPNFVLQESDQVQFQWVHLQAGGALYLPAGWLHEVFSHGGDCTTKKNDDKNNNNNNGIHMAINYWVHPPDVGDDPEICFERPYRSVFWQRDWDARQLE